MFFVCSVHCSLRCNFETECYDFILGNDWGLTDGKHPILIDHDHSLNSSLGHYTFFQPSSNNRTSKSNGIRSKFWTEVTDNQTVCLSMWIYSKRDSFTINIHLIQSDDEQMIRLYNETSFDNQTLFDWTNIELVLPNEKFKILIDMNTNDNYFVVDDLSIDVCDGPSPPQRKYELFCDFESSCSELFLSISGYPYQWQVIQAGKPPKPGISPPNYDYTYRNSSGHYVWINNVLRHQSGRVGYLITKQIFTFDRNQTYCLNFEYFAYAVADNFTSFLKVFAWTSGQFDLVQLWPPTESNNYQYSSYQWTWSLINLPVGYYSLVFRLETRPIFPSSFVLDNIAIISCDYSSRSLQLSNASVLSFHCNFDDNSTCAIENKDPLSSSTPSYNFELNTGNTIPKPYLGPNRDHTQNSTDGGFLYWNQTLPFLPVPSGFIDLNRTIEQSSGTCIQFAYYINSTTRDRNATTIELVTSDLLDRPLWTVTTDDSQGWQLITQQLENMLMKQKFYFIIQQATINDASVAFDDITIDQCDNLPILPTTVPSTTAVETTTTPLPPTSTTTTTVIETTTTSLTTININTTTTTIITTITTSVTVPSTSVSSSITTSTHNQSTRISVSRATFLFWLLIITFFCIFT